MNDLERDVRAVLARDAERAPLVTQVPSDIRKRVRRRQTGTALASALVAVALGAGAVLLSSSFPGAHQPADEGPGGRTSTVRGITLQVPEGWTLTELGGEVYVNEGPTGPQGTITGRTLFELSNFDPMDADGATFCDMSGWSRFPSGGALLHVQTLDFPRIPGSVPDGWPVDLGRLEATPGANPADANSDMAYATWTANGRVYEATLCGYPGPAFDRLRRVFATMTFGPEGPDAPAILGTDGTPAPGPFYVLDSGVAEGQSWNLLGYASRYPLVPSRVCIALEVEGRALDPQCDLDVAAAETDRGFEMQGMEGTSQLVTMGDGGALYAWGAVPEVVDGLEVRLVSGERISLSRVPLPASFDVTFDAVVVVGTEGATGEIASTVDGDTTGQVPFNADTNLAIEYPDTSGALAAGDDWTLYLRDWTEYPRDAGDGICFDLMGPENDETTCDSVWPPSGGDPGNGSIQHLPDDRALLFGFLEPAVAVIRVDNPERGWTVERFTFPPPEGFAFEGVAFVMELPAGRSGSTVTLLDSTGEALATVDLPAVGTGLSF